MYYYVPQPVPTTHQFDQSAGTTSYPLTMVSPPVLQSSMAPIAFDPAWHAPVPQWQYVYAPQPPSVQYLVPSQQPMGPYSRSTMAPATSPQYKTQMCRGWASTGTCAYGQKCQFAHGQDEMRPNVIGFSGPPTTTLAMSEQYKTQLCRGWAAHGTCAYRDKCMFAHGESDMATHRRPKTATEPEN